LKQLQLKEEWNIASIYSFFNRTFNEIPIIDWENKVRIFTRYIQKKVPGEETINVDIVKNMIHENNDDYLPVIGDTDDIRWILQEWAKDNLDENQFIHTECVEGVQCSNIRVMLFELKNINMESKELNLNWRKDDVARKSI